MSGTGNDDTDSVDGAAPDAALADLMARVSRCLELGLRVALPARVIAYTPATQLADLRVELLPVGEIEGEDVPQPPVLLPQVPVAWTRTSLGHLTLPLVPGDTGLAVFSDRSLSVWRTTGNEVAPVDPLIGRTHNLGDAVFFPGLHTDTDPIAPPTSLAATVLEGPLVQLGVGATQFVAIASLLHAYLVSMFTAAQVAGSANVGAVAGEVEADACLIYLAANPFTAFAATKVQAI